MKSIIDLTDWEKYQLVEQRWASSESVWDVVNRVYTENLRVYKNQPGWLDWIPAKRAKIRANRIFSNMEAVINALIANLPKPNILPNRETPEASDLATMQEKYFGKKYADLNVKETIRKGLRNLFLGRLIVIKPFWDTSINDFNARAIDPRRVRISKNATKEQESEFAIEEVPDNLISVCKKFPAKAEALRALIGYADDARLLIDNPEIVYKESWIRDHVIFSYQTLILDTIRNPYWDWDGLLVTPEEDAQLKDSEGEQRRSIMSGIRMQQDTRTAAAQGNMAQEEGGSDGTMPEGLLQESPQSYQAYYFNHFDEPRKPYIVATVFNNENTPIGQTDMIGQSIPLQEGIDRRKQDIDENASLVNGQIKVDSTVMSKADAQKLRYEARGVIWGKGVFQGVTREMGNSLPPFVLEDMVDSRSEIDNIMAASAAFRGEREGQETKAGRLALIEQSFQRLNELVQVVDYVNYELFNWFYQLAKVRYTEHHYAKDLGEENAVKLFTIIQDDFIDGTEVKVIPGKTLPEDRQFKMEQAQVDVEKGILSPVDYFGAAGYENPVQKAKNAVKYKMNPALAVGLSPEEMQEFSPQPASEPPKLSIAYQDLPPDGQMQLAAKAGIDLNPQILVAEKIAQVNEKREQIKAEDKRTQEKAKAK